MHRRRFFLSLDLHTQVLVALHLGVVWGYVKPDDSVWRGNRLVAVDLGSSRVEVGTTAQRELGADADTSFTPRIRPSDQFAWSVQYAAPERASCPLHRPAKSGLAWFVS